MKINNTVAVMTLVAAVAATARGLKVAFVGDTGIQAGGADGFFGAATYATMRSRNVELVVQNGDLDYYEDPAAWDGFLSQHAQGMDVLVGSGNHEEQQYFNARWYGSGGYKDLMERYTARRPALASNCAGAYGERYACTIQDNLFVVLGWRQTDGAGEVAASNAFLESQLSSSSASFKWCVWHRPEGKVNSGNTHTGNYGLEPLYETCRKFGAVVTNGHTHVYARTKLISSFVGDVTVSSNDAPNPTVGCGKTVSFVLGAGGFKHDYDGPYRGRGYWAMAHSRSNSPGDRAGVLICDVSGKIAACEYVETTGYVVDSFTITNGATGSCEAPAGTCTPVDADPYWPASAPWYAQPCCANLTECIVDPRGWKRCLAQCPSDEVCVPADSDPYWPRDAPWFGRDCCAGLQRCTVSPEGWTQCKASCSGSGLRSSELGGEPSGTQLLVQAIAGGAGAAAILLVALATIAIRRRRRRSGEPESPTTLSA